MLRDASGVLPLFTPLGVCSEQILALLAALRVSIVVRLLGRGLARLGGVAAVHAVKVFGVLRPATLLAQHMAEDTLKLPAQSEAA